MAGRVRLTDLLCVFVTAEKRAWFAARLRALNLAPQLTELPSGWIVLEAERGPLPSDSRDDLPLRVVLGGELPFLSDRSQQAVEHVIHVAAETPPVLDTVPGDFCFVGLGLGGRAIAVQSCSGTTRLYSFSQGGVTAISTRIDWIGRVAPHPLELDVRRLVSVEHALGIAPEHTSVLRGITQLPVGHVAHCGIWQTPRLHRYWFPRVTPPLQATVEEVAEELGPLLREELNRHLCPTGSNALLFSGGLDSSLLAGIIHRGGHPLDAVTILPPAAHPAHVKERYYTSCLTSWFRQHLTRPLDGEELLLRIRNHPGSLSAIVASEWLALGELERTPGAIVTGWFADEAFGHLRLPELFGPLVPDLRALWRIGSWGQLSRQWYRRRRLGRSAFHSEGLSVPPLFNPQAANDFEGWLRATTWASRPEAPAERLLLYRKLTDIAGAYTEAAAALGARVVAPFCARAVVELACRCTPRHLFAAGLAKAPLRRLAAHCLPGPVAQRSDKGDWGLADLEVARPAIDPDTAHLLDTRYLRAHPNLSLDEVGTILWVEALERGRVHIEHDRQTIWPK